MSVPVLEGNVIEAPARLHVALGQPEQSVAHGEVSVLSIDASLFVVVGVFMLAELCVERGVSTFQRPKNRMISYMKVSVRV